MKFSFEGKLYHVLEQWREEPMTLPCVVLCCLLCYSLLQLAGSMTHGGRQPLLLNLFANVWTSALHTHPHYKLWQVMDMNHRFLVALVFFFSLTQIVNISETVTIKMPDHQSHGAVSCNMGTHSFKEIDSSLKCAHPSVKWGPPYLVHKGGQSG